MNGFVTYKEKWETVRKQLQIKLQEDTRWLPTVNLGASILVKVTFHDADENTLIKEEFDKTIQMSDTNDVDTIYLCCQRMADLCQGRDYGPAGVWLGVFCEEILEKYTEAQYWYNKAAQFKDGMGMYRVGLLYLNKKVPLPATTSLKRCFIDALAHGVTEARDVLDKYFNDSNGTEIQH